MFHFPFPLLGKTGLFILALVCLVLLSGGRANSAMSSSLWLSVGFENGEFRVLPVPENTDLNTHKEWLKSLPSVISVEADAPVLASTVPNDPFYASIQASYLNVLGLPDAWEFATGGQEIVIAIIDSGIDLNHEEFVGRLWENPYDNDDNGIDDDGNGCIDDKHGCTFINLTEERTEQCGYTNILPTGDIRDDDGGSVNHSHGTLVAGILAATGDNQVGIAGVVWNVQLMIIKVLDCGLEENQGIPGGDMSNVAQAIDYARRMGADLINLSLASNPGDPSADLAILRNAIFKAGQENIIITAAVGNGGARGPGLPAAYTRFDNVIGVASADNNDEWPSYSAYGAGVDFAAYSEGVASTARSDIGLSTPYVRIKNGTSFATPFVTGMYALMKMRNPNLPIGEYLRIGREAARPVKAAIHGRNWAGAGIVDIGVAVSRVPFSITGTVSIDWHKAPPNLPIAARINGAYCGVSQTIEEGAITTFSIKVLSAAELSACGKPGDQIELVLDGILLTQSFVWGGRNEQLAVIDATIDLVRPIPSELVQHFTFGWNLYTYLGEFGFVDTVLELFPQKWLQIQKWDTNTNKFLEISPSAFHNTTVNKFDVFWLVMTNSEFVATPVPRAVEPRVVSLEKGWNVFTYTGPVLPVQEALQSLSDTYLQLLKYENIDASWLSYVPGGPESLNDLSALRTYEVYWVLLQEPDVLIMSQ